MMKRKQKIRFHLWFFCLLFGLVVTASTGPARQQSAVSCVQKEDEDKPVVIYGDTRNGHEVHKKIVSLIIPLRPAAVFNTGDLVFDGKSKKNWETFNSIIHDLLDVAPYYPVIGNHERGEMNIDLKAPLPGNGRWYSVDIGRIHFVVLDVCERYAESSEQYDWLVKDLANQPAGTRFTVVLAHYPLYSSGPHKTQTKKLRETLIPVFTKYGVDVVFSAHNHSYERSFASGIYYVVTAGGGAPLYRRVSNESWSQVFVKDHHFCVLDTRNDTLFITARDTSMQVLDRFFIPIAK